MSKYGVLSAMVVWLATLLPLYGHAATVDFSGFNEGDVFDDQFNSSFGIGNGVSLSIRSTFAIGSADFGDVDTSHPATLFDTNCSGSLTGPNACTGNDTDLAGPFVNGGTVGPDPLANTGLALIRDEVSDASDGNRDGTVDDPNDTTVQGTIVFSFSRNVAFERVDLLDIEEGGSGLNILLSGDGGTTTTQIADSLGVSEDGEYLRFFNPSQEQQVNWIAFEFEGSGALDNFVFDTNPEVVPVPAALPMLASGLGLLGWVGWRRRRLG